MVCVNELKQYNTFYSNKKEGKGFAWPQLNEADIIRGVDSRISDFIQTYGSREALEQMYGLSVSRMRDNLKKQYREQMMAEEVKKRES